MVEIRNSLIQTAKEMGASNAVIFNIEDICWDERTLLKCLFGCEAENPYCPNIKNIETVRTYSEIFKKYKWGVLIETDNIKGGQKISLELERKAFLAGFYFALASTECAFCDICEVKKGNDCISLKSVRPPLCALGVDVYKTVRKLELEIGVVQRKGDPIKIFTAVFIE